MARGGPHDPFLVPGDAAMAFRAVAYVETSDSSCPQTYGPVRLFMNADGDLAAVSLLMGEP